MLSTPKIIAAAAALLLAGAIITTLFFSKANNSLKQELTSEKLNSEKLLSEKLELKKNVDRANKDIDQFKTEATAGLTFPFSALAGMSGSV